MPEAQGVNAWLGYGVQTVLGTPVARTLFNDFNSESLQKISGRKQPNQVGATAHWIDTELTRYSEGSLEFDADFASLASLFKAAFGDGSVASVQQGATAAYLHTFTCKSVMPSPGLSIEVHRDSSSSFLYEGCKIEEVEFIQEPDDYLRVRFGIKGRNETQVSISTPTFSAPLVVHKNLLAVEYGDVSVNIDRFRLLLKNNLTGYRPQLATPDSKEYVRNGKFEVTGEISLTFDSLTRYNEFVNMTDVKLEFLYTGGVIPSGDANTYKLNLIMPKVHFTGSTPNVGTPGVLSFSTPFMAFDTARAANDLLKMELQNALTAIT